MTSDSPGLDAIAAGFRAEMGPPVEELNALNASPERMTVGDLLWSVGFLRAERGRHRAELAAIRGIHSEFRIYEVGADDHDDDADLVELDDGRYARRSGYQYSICRGCCASGDAQSELCADDHDHSECWPCPTYLAASPSTRGEEQA